MRKQDLLMFELLAGVGYVQASNSVFFKVNLQLFFILIMLMHTFKHCYTYTYKFNRCALDWVNTLVHLAQYCLLWLAEALYFIRYIVLFHEILLAGQAGIWTWYLNEHLSLAKWALTCFTVTFSSGNPYLLLLPSPCTYGHKCAAIDMWKSP